MSADRFERAVQILSSLGDGEEGKLPIPFVDALPVDGASVSTIGDMLGTETIAASDAVIARLDEVQFDLGEGPCWDALALAGPVEAPDMRKNPPANWPHFHRAIADQPIGALFAFPLLLGSLRIGAIDLYSTDPMVLDRSDAQRTAELADIVTRYVLRRAMRLAGEDERPEGGRFSRRTVHQATGAVIAQLGVSADDAQLLIQGHAFAQGRSMLEVAQDILDRRIRFTVSGNRIEEES
jgi:ANTAR domain